MQYVFSLITFSAVNCAKDLSVCPSFEKSGIIADHQVKSNAGNCRKVSSPDTSNIYFSNTKC